MEVRELMRPGVVSLPATATLHQARAAMLKHEIHAVLLLDDERLPKGWVTANGLLPWLDSDLGLLPADRAVTEEVRTISPNESASAAIETMVTRQLTHLLVARGSAAPEGVISAHDLLRAADTPRRRGLL